MRFGMGYLGALSALLQVTGALKGFRQTRRLSRRFERSWKSFVAVATFQRVRWIC
jgi:hypothetical protein